MSKRIGVYRLHNYSVGRAGEPFGMCDEHIAKYNPPFIREGQGRLQKLASDGEMPCENCERESEEGTDLGEPAPEAEG